MHALIFAPSHRAAEELQAELSSTVDHCTIVITWPDVLSHLEEAWPDLLVVQRSALNRMEPATMLSLLTEPGRWPPLVLVDAPYAGGRDGAALAGKLAQELHPYYQVGELRIDTRRKRAGISGRWVTLPPLQYRLLLALAQRAGEVVSYRELLRAVWGYDGNENEARELLKEHVRRIRRRLGLDPERHAYIRSVRGFGYMLAPPEEN